MENLIFIRKKNGFKLCLMEKDSLVIEENFLSSYRF